MSVGDLSEAGESGWLQLVRGSLSAATGKDLLVSIGDDAAVLRAGEGQAQILTCDSQVEGTHFNREWLDWGGFARRALLAARERHYRHGRENPPGSSFLLASQAMCRCRPSRNLRIRWHHWLSNTVFFPWAAIRSRVGSYSWT